MISPGISPSRGYGRWCECGCVGGCSSGLGVVVCYLWVLVPARDTGGGASVVVCYIWVFSPSRGYWRWCECSCMLYGCLGVLVVLVCGEVLVS